MAVTVFYLVSASTLMFAVPKLRRNVRQTFASSVFLLFCTMVAQWSTTLVQQHASLAAYRPPVPPAKEFNQPIPACYGSYSSWAGSANAFKFSFDKGSASFSSGTSKSTTLEGKGGDPGAYTPYNRTDLAAQASSTHNIRLQCEQRAMDASAEQTGDVLSASTEPLELFPLNRHELRSVKTFGDKTLPEHWVEGAKAAGQLAADYFSGLRPEARPACQALGFRTPSALTDALAIRSDIEARAKDEKLAKWEARHGRRGEGLPQPPPPPPGAAKRAAERLFEHAKQTQLKAEGLLTFHAGEEHSANGAEGGGVHCKPAQPTTAWGPNGLVGLTGQQAHDVWTGALDPFALPKVPEPQSPPQQTASPHSAPKSPPNQQTQSRHPRTVTPKAKSRPVTPPSKKAANSATRPAGSAPPRPTARAGTARASGTTRSSSPSGAASARPAPRKVVKRHPQVRNYYAVLHVTPEATNAEIKQAYHRLAKAWHPDRNQDEKAERTFKLINRAHEVLSDPTLRMRFDRGENIDSKFL